MDYISREAAKHDIVARARVINGPDLLSREDALTALDCIPAADVRPVRWGRWIFKRGYYEADECTCSLCGQLLTTPVKDRANFCPNCGADMHEKEAPEGLEGGD